MSRLWLRREVGEVDKAVGGVRFLPLSDDPKAVAAMQKIFRYAYVKEVQPRPAFAGVAGPTKLMTYDYLIVSGTHLKDYVAYRIVRTVHQNKEKLAASLAAKLGDDLRDAAAYGDSRHDLCLLEPVGYPVAVQPNPPLLATARGNRWDIIAGRDGARAQPQ